jgi:hypothetical protein
MRNRRGRAEKQPFWRAPYLCNGDFTTAICKAKGEDSLSGGFQRSRMALVDAARQSAENYKNERPPKQTSVCPWSVRKHRSHLSAYSLLMYRRARVRSVNGLPYRIRTCLASLQQTDYSSQSVPGRLVQCRVRPDEVADHLPSSNVEGALGWRSHSQGD